MSNSHDTQTLDGVRGRARGSSRSPFLHLIITAHDPAVTVARFSLDDVDRVILGRGDGRAKRSSVQGERELRIEIPDTAMSSRHASIERSADGWTIKDLGSKNGVFVDGNNVRDASADEGSILEVGRSFLTIRSDVGERVDQIGPATSETGIATLLPALEIQLKRALQVGRSEIPIVVIGETGTGKELVTRAVHKASGRSGACVAVNCGAIAPNLVESELFGYRKGAFSGALEDRPGLIRSAHGGTLFLDEIGELPAPVQIALLRALEQKAVVPVGGTTEIPVDFRLCSATNRDLRRLVSAGRFRSDLFARISGFTIELPPLRKRREDLGLLLAAIVRRTGARSVALTNDAVRSLLAHEWPQNIRELSKVIETALVLAQGEPIDTCHLTLTALKPIERTRETLDGEDDEVLRKRLCASLERHRGNLSAVARELDKDRVQIRRWMQRFHLDASNYRDDGPEDA